MYERKLPKLDVDYLFDIYSILLWKSGAKKIKSQCTKR